VASHDPGVHLAPEGADATAQLEAIIDLPGVDPASCRYAWRRNGALLSDENRSVLAPSNFRKNDDVQVEVSVPLPSGTVRTLNASMRINDAAPGVMSAQVSVIASTSGYELRGLPECSDPDGDSTTCAYRWFRNGKPIDGASGAGLPAAAVSCGDRIVVEVVASDGERRSEPRRSPEFVLENKPPQFTSQPSALKPGDTVFRYQAVAVDPDGDAIHYDLAEAPAGTTITPDGTVEWTLPSKELVNGNERIVIRATDSKGGQSLQTIDLHVNSGTPKSTGA
jgi:hypothetical protein